jgi:ferrochelatase
MSEHVRRLLDEELPGPVGLAMRYGRPSIEHGMQRLLDAHGAVQKLLVVPLYPHYAMATYETVVVAARKAAARLGVPATIEFVPPFYEDPLYLEALVASARPYVAQGFDHLLVSYHGLPERHLKRTDPTGRHCLTVPECCSTPSPAHATCYRAQVLATTRGFTVRAGIPPERCSVAFQSRMGRTPWLGPYTDQEFVRLAAEGVRDLLVICPSFVTDCLETIEEIGIRGRAIFREAGGGNLRLIPCLNDQPLWIRALAAWCSQ